MEEKLYCSQCARSEYDRDHVTKEVFLHCLPFKWHMKRDARNASQCYMFLPEGPIAEGQLRRILAARKQAKKERKNGQTTEMCRSE